MDFHRLHRMRRACRAARHFLRSGHEAVNVPVVPGFWLSFQAPGTCGFVRCLP
jgi:hypothetical protein